MNERNVRANGIDMHLTETGEGPPAVLLHGFPELGYSWRHQLSGVSGFHLIAPDLRGYGRTTAPPAVEAYGMREMVGDVVGLLDTLELSTAVIVGHDWGAQIAWACAQLFPERFPAIVALSVPYQVRTPVPMTQALREWAGNTFNWLLYFQEPGVAEAALGADVARTMRLIMYGLSGDAGELGLRLVTGLPKDADLLDSIPEPDALPAWLSESELAHYIEEFDRTGFTGGLNRYRNVDRDWHELPALGATTVQQPVLLAAGEHDSATRYMDVKKQREYVPNLREPVIFEGCGHWIQQERAERVNGLLVSFLRDMAAAPEVLWG